MTTPRQLTKRQEAPPPEAFCERCARPNLPAWWVASDLWNATLRGPERDEWDVLCPQCFAEVAEAKGIVIRPVWELRLDHNDGKPQADRDRLRAALAGPDGGMVGIIADARAVLAGSEPAPAEAELLALRPVVEAAKEWRKTRMAWRDGATDKTGGPFWHAGERLAEAVDAYRDALPGSKPTT